jgi:hypothetical protein
MPLGLGEAGAQAGAGGRPVRDRDERGGGDCKAAAQYAHRIKERQGYTETRGSLLKRPNRISRAEQNSEMKNSSHGLNVKRTSANLKTAVETVQLKHRRKYSRSRRQGGARAGSFANFKKKPHTHRSRLGSISRKIQGS